MNCIIAPLVLAQVALGSMACAQTNERLELQELKTTLQISAEQIQDLEAKLASSKGQINSLSESLAAANVDGQQAREGFDRVRLQIEGLGIAALDASNAGLQQRLLTALSDLRILEAQKRKLDEALIGLSEAALSFEKNSTPSDPASKAQLDKSLTVAEKVLGSTSKAGEKVQDNSNLQSAQVVSLKEEMGIAVLNVGSRHGVHPGMPFSIFRKDKPVAHALVVDVRQGICGAVVRDLVSKDEPVKIGDTGRVETSKG